MSKRVARSLPLLIVAAMLHGCDYASQSKRGPVSTPEAAPPGAPPRGEAESAALHRLRNLAKLHADRDTGEGRGEAAAALRQVVEKSPRTFLDRLNMARVLLLDEPRAPEAGEHLIAASELLAGNEGRAALAYLSGLHAKRILDDAAAVSSFEQAASLVPRLLQAWFQLGRAYEDVGRNEDARKSYERALEISPRYRPAAYRLYQVCQALRDGPAREEAFRLFDSLPERGHEDTEKCSLTLVELRPYDRAAHEPPAVALDWREETERFLGAAEVGSTTRVLPFDAEGDGDCDLLLLGAGDPWLARFENGAATLVRSPARAAVHAGLGEGVIADFDNDGRDEAACLDPESITLFPGGPIGDAGRAGTPRAAAAFDADHDGDLDLVLLVGRQVAVLRNNGDGSWLSRAPFAESSYANTARLRIDGHDFDQGNDIDFVFPGTLPGGGPGVVVALNLREERFRLVALPELGAHTFIFAEDLNNDGAPDVFACGGAPGWSYAFNQDRLGVPQEVHFGAPVRVDAPACGEIHDAALADLDNDMDQDVLLAAESGLTLLRNRAGGVLEPEPVALAAPSASPRSVVVADLDGDAILEVIVTTADGVVRILTSGPSPAYAGWTLRPTGGRDNRNGIGTVVEQFAGARYQSLLLRGPKGVHLGTGARDTSAVDGVRLRWPQGILQPEVFAELKLGAGREARFPQKEGQVVSCPFLYGRGAGGWRFLTDVVGLAPLDEWLPPGKTPHLDPEEYVRIEGAALASHDGRLELCITEELKETTYLDRVELLVIDLPRGVEVYADESTRQGPYDPLALVLVRGEDLLAPARVTLESGADATALAAARDGRYVHAYADAPSQWYGWVPRHTLGLEIPERACALFLCGRVAWYDSTVAFSLAQHGRAWGPLALHGILANGATTTLVEDLGLPAGMDRTMVARFAPMPAGSTLRLTAHHRLLWDWIRVARDASSAVLSGPAGETVTAAGLVRHDTVPVERAILGYHGYSQMDGHRARHEQGYLFDRAAPEDVFLGAAGMATRYGEVTGLLLEHDDLLAVLVAADRVMLEFGAPPPPAAGEARTYFLRVSGWAKEANYHNRTGRSIEPLPFRSMRSYPPAPGTERMDAAYRAYLDAYQTRPIRRGT